jgi:hypothetical protein
MALLVAYVAACITRIIIIIGPRKRDEIIWNPEIIQK